MPTDDIALLNQLRRSGEITDEQYETLRRHVLWGTPLPELLEEELGQSAVSESEEELPAELSERAAGSEAPARRFTPTLPPRQPAQAAPPEVPTGPPPSFAPQLRPRPQSAARPAVTPPRQPLPQPAPPQPSPPPAAIQPPPGLPQLRPGIPQPPPGMPPQLPPAVPPQAQPPRRRRSWVPYLAGGITAIVILAALGVWWFALRGDPATPEKYAGAACPDLSSWQRDIAKSANAMTTAVNNAGDAAVKQRAAERFFTAAGTRTDQLATALGDDEAPRGGKPFARQLVDAVQSASAMFKSSAQQTSELETSASSFLSGLQVIIRDPQQPVTTVETTLAKAPEAVRTALANESACSGLHLPKP